MICACCHTTIGAYSHIYHGLNLYKWQISVKRSDNAVREQIPAPLVASAYLLDLIESRATRRFMAYSGRLENATDGLLVSNDVHWFKS